MQPSIQSLTNLFGRMQQLGLVLPISIYGKSTVRASGVPVARSRGSIGVINGYISTSGGSILESQEGPRVLHSKQIYYLTAGVTCLAESNYQQRWILMPGENRLYRIADMQTYGPYAILSLEIGGTTDTAGNVK